jgi:2',3'-cyclic-nucleotide 2'-phosphodiesterase (5'-nucleotidase family)
LAPLKNLVTRLLLAGALLGALGLPAVADPNTVTITILHTNDMHGHLEPEVDKSVAPAPEKVGGAAYMAGLIEALRAKHPQATLLIDGGDIAQGTPISNMFQGRPMVEFMNDMNYDAGTIGNHEFDWGPAPLAAMIRGAKRPIVCANLVETATGKAPAGVKPFIVKSVAGVKVGIIGLVTPTTPSISFKQNVAPFRFVDEVDTMLKMLPLMRKAGAQVIVVASHLGEKADKALAAAVPGIDVIVGGHSHTVIKDPVVVDGTVIVQAGKYMRYLGHLDVTIDKKSWKVVDYTKKDELVPVLDAKIAPDPTVAALVKKYHDQVAPAMEQVLGQASDDLTRTDGREHADSILGDVVTDALRWKVRSDVAVYNAGGIRTDFNKGPIKLGDVYTLLPFDNYVVTLEMSGDQIQRLVAQGLGDGHGTIQVSGLTFRIGADGKPADIKIGGQPLETGKMYKVATVDFLAEGNDGLTVFKEVKDRVYDELARDVFTAYVRKSSPLAAPATGRIVRSPR